MHGAADECAGGNSHDLPGVMGQTSNLHMAFWLGSSVSLLSEFLL